MCLYSSNVKNRLNTGVVLELRPVPDVWRFPGLKWKKAFYFLVLVQVLLCVIMLQCQKCLSLIPHTTSVNMLVLVKDRQAHLHFCSPVKQNVNIEV